MAINSAIAEPMMRPTTPKNAPLLTGPFVPVRGPISAIGANSSAPRRSPTMIDENADHQLRPKLTGSAPRTIRPNVRLAPMRIQKMFIGFEWRSSSGM